MCSRRMRDVRGCGIGFVSPNHTTLLSDGNIEALMSSSYVLAAFVGTGTPAIMEHGSMDLVI